MPAAPVTGQPWRGPAGAPPGDRHLDPHRLDEHSCLYHTASLLQDRQVLVADGEDFGAHVDNPPGQRRTLHPLTTTTGKEKQPWHHDGSGR
jgi:hypothetical protein